MHHGRIQAQSQTFPELGPVISFPTILKSSLISKSLKLLQFCTYPFTKFSAYRNLIVLRIFILLKDLLLNTLWDQKLLDKERQMQKLRMPWFPSDYRWLSRKQGNKVICTFSLKTKQEECLLICWDQICTRCALLAVFITTITLL